MKINFIIEYLSMLSWLEYVGCLFLGIFINAIINPLEMRDGIVYILEKIAGSKRRNK